MMSKWISADSIINKFNSHVGFTTCADVKRAIKLIQDEPGIDIVRCKDCRKRFSCITFEGLGDPDGFCSGGERDVE